MGSTPQGYRKVWNYYFIFERFFFLITIFLFEILFERKKIHHDRMIQRMTEIEINYKFICNTNVSFVYV